MLRTVWITKQHWLKAGPMTYMGLLNGRAFADNEIATDFFVRAERNYDPARTEHDLLAFYGLEPHPFFTVHAVPETRAWLRSVYQAAIAKIVAYHEQGDDILTATRDYGALTMLLSLKKKYPRIKVLYESHNFFINLKHLDKRPWSLSRLRTRWVERHELFKADGLICLTEHQRALYQHWFPELPTIALSLGCLSFADQPLPERRRLQRRVAYIGHLYDYKGLELFFELAALLKPAQVELRVIGGHAHEVTALQQRADEAGLGETLRFQAFVEPKMLHEILGHDISIGLAPLQDTFYNRYLTCPVKVLDFLAHGLPIVASELPSIREVLQGTGHYCDCRNAAEFADRIIKLLDHADAYQQASLFSDQRAQVLQWRSRARRILDFAATL